MAVKTPVVSTLNPDAPLFVPAAYVAAEDFSPEWWRLIQTSPAFRDYWLRERYIAEDDDMNVEEMDEVVDDYLEFEREMEEEMEAESEVLHLKNENGSLAGGDLLLQKDGEIKDTKKGGMWSDPVKQYDRVPQKLLNNTRKGAYRIQQPRAM